MEKANRRIKEKLTPLSILLLVLLCIYTLVLLAIFLWIFITACKGYYGDYLSMDPSVVKNNIVGLPKKFLLFENLKEINTGFANQTLAEKALYTVLYAFGCSFFKTIVTCVVAYLCARYKNPFSKLVYAIVVISMILPIVGSQATEIQVAKDLGLYDQIWGMWIMRANFLGLYFLVFYAIFKSMPDAYYEAAVVDGANDAEVMVKIAMPLATSSFMTVFLINFIEYWNDYLAPNLYLPSYDTLSLALYHQSQGQELAVTYLQQVPYIMTTVTVVTVPVIILFAVFSDRLMGNLSVGGIKG